MLRRIIDTLKVTSSWRLLALSVVFAEVFSTIFTSLMSLAFHGRIRGDFLITSGVVALLVSFAVAFVLIGLIREVQKAEKKAEEEKTAIGSLLRNSAVATFVVNPDHKVVFWNKACEELTGVSAPSIVGTGDHWKPFYAQRRPTLADLVIDGNTEALSALYDVHARSTLVENGLHAEGWYKNMNERDRYIIFDAAPVYDAKGTLVFVVETLEDITEQKQLAEKLKKNESLLRTIIDTEPECVKLIAANGNILRMNPAGLAMLEADFPDQVVGRDMISLVAPEYRSSMQALSRSVFGGGAGTLEFEVIGLKGTRRWLETHAAPLRDSRGEISALLGVTRDISEHKRWEKTLEEQLRFLQLLIDTIPMPVFYKDIKGVYQGCNKAFEKYLGLTKDGIIGKSVYELAPKELADKYHAMDKELFDHPGVQTYEYSVRHADGAIHEVIFNKATYLDRQGGVAGLLGVIQDITERKETERVIQRNYDTQTAINWILNISLKDIPLDGILKQTLDVILSIPWLSFEGRGSVFLVEEEPDKLVMKAQRGLDAAIQEACRIVPFGACLCGRAASEGQAQFADRLDHRHEVSYEGMGEHGHYCVPIKQGNKVLGVINMYLRVAHKKDRKEIEFLNAIASALAGIITRKKIEEERELLIKDQRTALGMVMASQKEWQDTFDSIKDMIAIVGKDFTILKANKAFSAYYGLQPQESVHRKCYELVHDGVSPIPNCPHGTSMNEKTQALEEFFDKKTNRLFHLSTFPYSGPEGEVIGSIHVMRDITDEKEKETRLILNERLATLGEMASGLAHEINNPLASIAGCSEGLLSRVKKGQWDAKLFDTYLNIIQEEVFRCKSITTAMLSFVRKTTYEKKELDLVDMLDRAVEVIGFQGRLKHIEVKRNYPERPLLIHGNEGELRQVFLVVITNALDAMDDKGVLTLEAYAADGDVIRISDTGLGIPEESLPKIFNPFFTTKADKGGTGLGLSIARKIVMNHNGTIEVSSSPGKGTTFTITLPQ